ncbi:MAG: hypothetical protein JO102_04725 [Elusimicrobia bacterium]|nr:hypothetical protein [Elusimicrobiota bacterium]
MEPEKRTDTNDLRERVAQVMREWDALITEKRQETEKLGRHAEDIIRQLEKSEVRTGKDLSGYKDAFRRL